MSVFGIIFAVYTIAVVCYFIFHKMNTLNDEIRSSYLNPFNVLNEEFLLKAETFFDLTGIAVLVEPIFLVLVLLMIYTTSLNEKILQLSKKTRWKFTQFVLYTFMIGMIVHVARLPFSFINNFRWRYIPPGEVSFSAWFVSFLGDVFSTWALAAFILGLVYVGMYYFQKRWWIASWIISIPIIYLMFGNASTPMVSGLEQLKQPETVAAIQTFIEKEELGLEGVYSFEASELTDMLDVSVHISGNEVQVIIWDTAAKVLTDEELVYIVANKFYALENEPTVMQVVILIALSYVIFFVASRVLKRLVPDGEYGQFQTVPVSWAILLLAMFIIMPVMNSFDRDHQLHVDRVALEVIEQPEIAVEALKKMALHQPVQLNESILFDLFGTNSVGLIERLENISK